MQAKTRSSSLSAVSGARTHGEGYGTTSVGCMGGWIHIDLRGILAGDLNNCSGWDGGIKWVATSYMPTRAALNMLIISKVGTGAFPSVSIPSIPLGSSTQCAGLPPSVP
jgi:hypothetical protein